MNTYEKYMPAYKDRLVKKSDLKRGIVAYAGDVIDTYEKLKEILNILPVPLGIKIKIPEQDLNELGSEEAPSHAKYFLGVISDYYDEEYSDKPDIYVDESGTSISIKARGGKGHESVLIITENALAEAKKSRDIMTFAFGTSSWSHISFTTYENAINSSSPSPHMTYTIKCTMPDGHDCLLSLENDLRYDVDTGWRGCSVSYEKKGNKRVYDMMLTSLKGFTVRKNKSAFYLYKESTLSSDLNPSTDGIKINFSESFNNDLEKAKEALLAYNFSESEKAAMTKKIDAIMEANAGSSECIGAFTIETNNRNGFSVNNIMDGIFNEVNLNIRDTTGLFSTPNIMKAASSINEQDSDYQAFNCYYSTIYINKKLISKLAFVKDGNSNNLRVKYGRRTVFTCWNNDCSKAIIETLKQYIDETKFNEMYCEYLLR